MNMTPENPMFDAAVEGGSTERRNSTCGADLHAAGPAGPDGKPLGLVVEPARPGGPSGVSGGPSRADEHRRAGVLAAVADFHHRRAGTAGNRNGVPPIVPHFGGSLFGTNGEGCSSHGETI